MDGLCQCGCGRPTAIAKQNDTKQGYIKGQPKRFLRGHAGKSSVDYVIEDRGYETPCWIWQRAITTGGYGTIQDQGKTRLAHVVYRERKIGKVPKGTIHHHRCEQRACVNPDHIELHTERSHRRCHAKLSEAQVELIQQMLEVKMHKTKIAAFFNVNVCTISDIQAGRTWT